MRGKKIYKVQGVSKGIIRFQSALILQSFSGTNQNHVQLERGD